MLIRRNSKEFHAIKNMVADHVEDSKRKKLIKLYSLVQGKFLKTKILLNDAGMDLYYGMAYDQVISNFEDDNTYLHKSEEEENLFYFVSSNSKEFPEAPFEIDPSLLKNLSKYEGKRSKNETETVTETGKEVIGTETGTKRLGKAERQKKESKALTEKAKQAKPERPKKESKTETVKKSKPKRQKLLTSEEKPTKLKKEVKEKVPEHEKQTPKPIIIEKEPQPDFQLKRNIEFHDLKKTLFPSLRITKEDVLNYYNDMSGFLLPYLKDRPQFFRWHGGDIKESTYYRSLRGFQEVWKDELPAWVETTQVYAKKYEEKVDYFVCKDKAHLLFLVEMGCIDLNPWHSRTGSIDKPDYIVIDLNPVEADFKQVVQVALKCKDVLDAMELPAFVKSSGNKGLHLYIPLDAKSDFEISRELCESLCKIINISIPDVSSLNRQPEDRKGKIYLDAQPNAIVKSIAVPYCIRPNDFAGVPTPLYWEEVNEKLDLKDHNFHTIMERVMRKGDPFADLFKKRVNAEKCLAQIKAGYGFLL